MGGGEGRVVRRREWGEEGRNIVRSWEMVRRERRVVRMGERRGGLESRWE